MPISPLHLQGHSRDISCLKFNRDGDLVFTGSKDASVQVWYTKDGSQLGNLQHGSAVASLDITARSEYVLASTTVGSTLIHDVETGALLYHSKSPVSRPIVDCIWLIGDQYFATVQRAAIYIYKREFIPENVVSSANLATAEVREPFMTIQVPEYSDLGDFSRISSIDGVGTILVAHTNGFLSRWNALTGDLIDQSKLDDTDQPLSSITLTQDRGLALVTSRSGEASLLRTADYIVLKSFSCDRPLNCGAISPIRNHTILAGGQDKHEVTTSAVDKGAFQIQFWHTIFDEKLSEIDLHYGPVNAVDVTRDGKVLASAGEDGNAYIYHFDANYMKITY